MNIIQNYLRSLKHTQVEEILDLVIFRPLAYLMVLILYRLPITPNQITLLAMITGIICGYYYSLGDRSNFMIAGVLYGLSNTLDCSDGMIARMKGNGTKVGRIVDGFVDYIVSIAVYVGLAIGLEKSGFDLPYAPWTLVIAAGISAAAHAIIFDYYRNMFLAHAIGKVNSIHDEINEFTEELERLRSIKKKPFDRFLIKIYLGYCRLQAGNEPKAERNFDKDRYFQSNKTILRLWSFIGSTSHISVLMVASFFYEPMWFFYYVIIFGNVWMLLLWVIQIQINKRIEHV